MQTGLTIEQMAAKITANISLKRGGHSRSACAAMKGNSMPISDRVKDFVGKQPIAAIFTASEIQKALSLADTETQISSGAISGSLAILQKHNITRVHSSKREEGHGRLINNYERIKDMPNGELKFKRKRRRGSAGGDKAAAAFLSEMQGELMPGALKIIPTEDLIAEIKRRAAK